MNIKENWEVYRAYPSVVTQRDGVKEVTFPKIHICLNSAHSAAKLRRFYPEIDETLIKKFYGVSGMTMTKELWNKLVISKLASKMGQAWKGTEHINLTEFYENTRPKYILAHCMLEYIDCRSLWEVRSKYFEVAFELIPIELFSYKDGIMLRARFSTSDRTVQTRNASNYDKR